MINFLKKIIPTRLFKTLQPVYHFFMAYLAAFFYKFPSRRLIIIGITGTAGKTSIAYLIMKMLNAAGYKTGLSSTAIFSDGDKEWLNDKKMTMPGRFFIQNMLVFLEKKYFGFFLLGAIFVFFFFMFSSIYKKHYNQFGKKL